MNLHILALLLFALPLAAQSKPNFIVIFADDLGYGDLSAFGATAHETPHLDKMAADGMRLTEFYVPMPFCGPSRGSLLTGRYPFRTKLVTNPTPDVGRNGVGLAPSEITIAEALKPLGYATSAVGKWHLGHVEKFLPRKQGFDEYYGILYSNDMRPVQLVENETVVEYPVMQSELTKKYTQRSIDFIERNRDKPFFLYLPHAMPHKPLAASEDFYTPETPDDLYSDAIRELDWSVGQILAKVRELNLDENTFVFFTSDNGATFGGYNGGLRATKGSNFDGGVHVPAIAWWPGTIPSRQVSAEPVASVDVFATIVTAAGGKLPGDRVIDGLDLMPLFTGRTKKSPHEAIFAMGGEELKLVRSGRWKLHVRSPQPGSECLAEHPSDYKDARGPDGLTIIAQFEQPKRNQCPGLTTGPEPKPMMLFDLESDRGEQRDVAAENPEVVARLRKMFDEMDAQTPDSYPPLGPRSPGILWIKGGELRYDRMIEPVAGK